MCLEVLNQIMEEVPTFETPLNYNSEDSGQSPNISTQPSSVGQKRAIERISFYIIFVTGGMILTTALPICFPIREPSS